MNCIDESLYNLIKGNLSNTENLDIYTSDEEWCIPGTSQSIEELKVIEYLLKRRMMFFDSNNVRDLDSNMHVVRISSAIGTDNIFIDNYWLDRLKRASSNPIPTGIDKSLSNYPRPDQEGNRFSGAPWFKSIRDLEIVLAGLGGIGSYLALLISRLGPSRLILLDPDVVEMTNLSGQLYDNDSIGYPKTQGCSLLINKYSSFRSYITITKNYQENPTVRPIMLCGFDNMDARKFFFEKWLNNSNGLFLDGRLAAEEFQIFCIDRLDEDSIRKYKEEWLFPSSEAERTICSYKQTSHMSNMIASVIVNLLVNYVTNQIIPYSRVLPFMTTYNCETMYMKCI